MATILMMGLCMRRLVSDQSIHDDPCPQPKATELDLGAVEEGCLV